MCCCFCSVINTVNSIEEFTEDPLRAEGDGFDFFLSENFGEDKLLDGFFVLGLNRY